MKLNDSNRGNVPLGFGMALAQNQAAMNAFANLSEAERDRLIQGAHNVRSKQEMQTYVNAIGKDQSSAPPAPF